jgi:hypothetical protein
MSDREIFCKICKRKVGIIRDAKLMIGLVFICPGCDLEEDEGYDVHHPEDNQYKTKETEDFMNMFGNIFKK